MCPEPSGLSFWLRGEQAEKNILAASLEAYWMKMISSVMLQRMRAGRPALMFLATPTAHDWFVGMAGLHGYHGLWIDGQHQNYSEDQIAHLCLACRASGMDAVVRVRKRDAGSYSRALECGAHGVIIPHVNTAAEATAIVRELKFPPVGNRGLDGVEPHAQFGYIAAADYVQQANAETFIVVQIEEPEAVDHVDAIAAVPGVDVLMIGPGDLSLRYGVPGQWNAPLVQTAIAKVATAARTHGKWWGLPVGSATAARQYLEMGALFFAHGSVYGFVREGFDRVRRELGELFDLRAPGESVATRGY